MELQYFQFSLAAAGGTKNCGVWGVGSILILQILKKNLRIFFVISAARNIDL